MTTKRAQFADFAPHEFPVTISMWAPTGELVWSETIARPPGDVPVAVPIPGHGRGAVRYVTVLLGDGTGFLHDDPSCGGTVN